MESIIKIEKVTKSFDLGINKVHALNGVDLEIHPKDFAIIYGPSGCGKSTLLNVISGLEAPTTGKVVVREEDLYSLSDDQRAQFRSEKFGIISQSSHWVNSLNVWQNVAIPLVLKGNSFSGSKKRALDVLSEIGMEEFADNPPNKLSGGQQQRVSIARALIRNPWIIIADEPTGNLDTHNSDATMAIFQRLNLESKRTIIMVTHNLVYLPYATVKIAMRDGVVASQSVADIAKQLEQEVATLKESK